MPQEKDKRRISSFKGSDRDALLNTNAELSLKNMGYGDVYPHMVEASRQTGGKVQPWETFTTISREAKFDPKAQAPIDPKTGKRVSSAKGWGQFTDATAREMGLEDRFDPIASVYAITSYLGKIKKSGALRPEEAEEGYMLGEGGWKRYHRGDTNVSGIKDIPALHKNFSRDVDKLLSGVVTPEAWTGKKTVQRYDPPQMGKIPEGKPENDAPVKMKLVQGALSQFPMSSKKNLMIEKGRNWIEGQRKPQYDNDFDEEISNLGII